jgi:polysaccharide biosynthesis/export protein
MGDIGTNPGRWLLLMVIGAVPLGVTQLSAGQSLPTAVSVPSKAAPEASTVPPIPSTYVLGPDDALSFMGIEVDELGNKQFRIDPAGDISLPMVGRLHAAGLTVRQFEDTLNEHLSTYIRDPHVVVTITEFRSQPVSVLGAVKTPGTYQLQGRKTVVEVISLAGGFREDAGNTIKITRELEWGKIPLPNAMINPLGNFSVAEVRIKEIMDAKDPQNNILMMPHDVVTVPRAELVYVIGDVKKAGGFVLSERSSMSVLQALSLAEGSERTADTRRAKILRLEPGQEQRKEIAVNLKKILDGTSNDVPLQAGDILFVPGSTAKRVGVRTLEAAVQIGTGVAIWRP